MRTLLRVSMEVNATNQTIREGKIQQTVDSLVSLVKPEAVYFTAINGKRTGLIVFDLKDPSMIPQIAEPFFSAFNAEIDFSPVMNREDLAKGLKTLQGLKKAA